MFGEETKDKNGWGNDDWGNEGDKTGASANDGGSWGNSDNNFNENRDEESRGRGRGRGRGGRGRGRGGDRDGARDRSNNADNQGTPGEPFEELFVRGVSYDSTEDDLKDVFSKYGEIVKCRLLKDKETQKSRGCGFVKFSSTEEAEKALNDADNISCGGRSLQMRYSNDREGEFRGRKGRRGGDEGGSESGFGGRGRGRGGRGGDRGGRGGDRRGGRGRGRDFGGNDNSNNNGSNWDNKNDDGGDGWGNTDNKERSRSKEKKETAPQDDGDW